MSIEANIWASLQSEWGRTQESGLPDLEALVTRARRERRRTWVMMVAEWAVAAAALAALGAHWRQLDGGWLGAACWGLLGVVTIIVLASATWTRVRSLAEPRGASLHAWLQLRRRRALLGLRLARLARWTVIALLPTPVIALIMATDGTTGWRTLLAVAVPALVLAGGWLWARRETVRLRADVLETDALAIEWLGQALSDDGADTLSR